MNTRRHCYALLLGLGLATAGLAPRAQAAFDAYLKIEGIPGESTDSAHPRWIDIQAFHWQWTTNAPSRLQVIRPVDAASPLLQLACAQGKHIRKAVLELVRRQDRRVRFYQITLEDVLISRLQTDGAAGSAPGTTEGLALNFNRISWSYTEFKDDGKALQDWTAYWDAARGTGDGALVPALQVSGAPSLQAGQMQLTLPPKPGVSYRVLGSDDIGGPYLEVLTVAGDLGQVTLAAQGARRFFVVQEVTE